MKDFEQHVADAFGIDLKSTSMLRSDYLAESTARFLSRLVDIRREQGLTQKDVADRLGIKQATVSDFERMDSDPKLSTVRKYAHAIEALIKFRVEADTGQLNDDRSRDWEDDSVRQTTKGQDNFVRPRRDGLAQDFVFPVTTFQVDFAEANVTARETVTIESTKRSDFALGA